MIAKKIPFFCFDDHTMIFEDGSLGVGFKLTGVDISTASPEMINSVSQKIESLLVGLPENIRLQVFYRLTNSACSILDKHSDASSEAVPNYQPIRDARIEFLNKKMGDDALFIPEIYVFLRSASLNLKKRKFFEKEETFQGFPEKEFLAAKERFYILVSQFEASLRSALVGPVRLLSDEWFKLAFSYFNFERSENLGNPKLRNSLEAMAPSISSQLALTDISVSEKHLAIGNLKFRAISQSLLPEGTTYASMIEGLLRLPFHYWLSQNIQTLEQRKEIEGLELKRRIANSMANGSNNVSDIESESKLSSIEDLLPPCFRKDVA